jgi:hypothetical protein
LSIDIFQMNSDSITCPGGICRCFSHCHDTDTPLLIFWHEYVWCQ